VLFKVREHNWPFIYRGWLVMLWPTMVFTGLMAAIYVPLFAQALTIPPRPSAESKLLVLQASLGVASLMTGGGFLASFWSYRRIRKKLAELREEGARP
jgi:hypothetical protein